MVYSKHAKIEMVADDLGTPNILAAVINSRGMKQENGTRLHKFMGVAVVLGKDRRKNEDLVITAWREK